MNFADFEKEDELSDLLFAADKKRKALESQQSGPDWGGALQAGLAGVAAGFQGKDSMAAANEVMTRNEAEKRQAKEALERWKQGKMQELVAQREAKKAEREDEKYDPTSQQSMAFRKIIEANFPNIAQAYGDKWNDVTAGDQDAIFKPLQLKEQMDMRREQAKILAGQRQDAREDRKFQQDLKREEKMQGLKTPYGLANTEDDAKKLKEAFESKKNFDNKIQEMIALREKHGGGAILNREDVARGKQLSKDLLLEYKNMAKLGVLSQADENIINAIIPADPLEYNSPLAAIQGQDPTLNRLKKFKADSDSDFTTRIGTRTRSGIDSVAQAAPSDSSGKVEMYDPKGRKKLVDKKDVPAALAAGGTLVNGPTVGGN